MNLPACTALIAEDEILLAESLRQELETPGHGTRARIHMPLTTPARPDPHPAP